VISIPDVHGDLAAFVKLLAELRLIDDGFNWIGGRTTLIQTGDLVDRGNQGRECLELLFKLHDQAPLSGGRVVMLVFFFLRSFPHSAFRSGTEYII
jgi:hypothetical protein